MKKKRNTLLSEALEFQLLPRLKLMGFMLIALGIAACAYGFFSTLVEEEALESEELISSEREPFELNASEKLQFYTISSVFSALGLTCILTANYKKKKLGY